MTGRRRIAGRMAAFLGAFLVLALWPVGARAQQIDWAKVNPAYSDAEFVKDAQVCAGCHEAPMHKFSETQHARMFRNGKMPAQGECESCHGPRSKHVEEPTSELAWDNLNKSQQSAVCMQCHEGGSRMTWKAGAHMAADVSCTSCHNPMEKKSEQGLLVRAGGAETCYSCHSGVKGQLSKASRHPVREGKMDCESCHNVHGSNPSLLKSASMNETCAGCHTEKRGPFVWEHAPVRESCANCHDAHGSNNRQLLNKKESFVCLQCHSYGGHINLPRYNRTSNPYGQGCVNCHVTVHGSNHPSGVKLVR